MPRIEYDLLVEGYELPLATFELTLEAVSRYIDAVGELSTPPIRSVPPLAMAAYALKALLQSITLPPGTIHTSQETEFFKSVPPWSTISCHAKVVQKQVRARFRSLAVETSILDQAGELVLRGKTTLILP